MQYGSDALRHLGPAAFVLEAILASVAANAALLLLIVARRAYRNRLFSIQDQRVRKVERAWAGIICGRVRPPVWLDDAIDREIVTARMLERLEIAEPEEAAQLLRFVRSSGLMDRMITEARSEKGWKKVRALVRLGRTRAPESVRPLAEALADADAEVRLAALHGLGRSGHPKAGEEILRWLAGQPRYKVPVLPLQGALMECCAEEPRLLLRYLPKIQGEVRLALARVLGEIADPSMSNALLELSGDGLDELRAAAARGLAKARPSLAVEALLPMASDPVWYVRLRAITSLRQYRDRRAVPVLLRAVCDSHRLVRFRAAEALVDFESKLVPIFRLVNATGDRYAIDAYLTALERAGLSRRVEQELEHYSSPATRERLLYTAKHGHISQPAESHTAATAAEAP